MQVVQEGQLAGEFEGFNDWDTVFEFTSGHKWQQNEYKYLYHYAYMPRAKVVLENGRYYLEVAGVNTRVQIRRI